jgi:divalent metal cation (Fe/Co/Zn/Cd) transporter
LVIESKGLLIGEGVDPATLAKIKELLRSERGVRAVRRMLTMHFGPGTVLLTMDLEFRDGLSASEIADAVDRLKEKIRSAHPEIKHIFIESESIRAGNPRTDRGSGEVDRNEELR